MRITSTNLFIIKSNKIHNNKYDYSLVDYKKSNLLVKIICPIHGVFEQRARNHLQGQGCPICNGKFLKSKKLFIYESNIIHNNKYDYSLVDYKNNKTKIKIICPIHGVFEQRPDDHLNGRGCRKCGGKDKKDNITFIKESIKIHGNFYNYDKTNYINNIIKIIITCPIHGDFKTTPNNHLSKKSGCALCHESNGERKIRLYLNEKNIKYIFEKRFKNCKYKYCLPFDFYLPDYNICIEYDGKQHFESIDFFGGEKRLNEQIIKDNIKTEYCKNNNIKLIRIKYNEDIYKILELIFNYSNESE